MTSVDDVTRFICLFHSEARAHAALDALEKLGIPQSEMDVVGGEHAGAGASENLASLGVPAGDLKHLQDGIQSGGMLISLRALESRSGEIERIFHHYNADKIDETETRTQQQDVPVEALAAAPVLAARPAETNVGDTVLPIAQEELHVGKREVERGGVRVLRRTVAEPVSESVELHDERVVVGYREVNRAATDADLAAGAQEFELIETAEVPVVQKVARVVEEVHVGKVATDHTEVIRDSVRHTEVEVEQVDDFQGQSVLKSDSQL